MQVEMRNDGNLAILRQTGSLNAAVIDPVRDEWFKWLEGAQNVRNVILDLSAVEFIDSSGMGLLIAMLKRITPRGGDLKIAGLRKTVRMVFEITRTYKIFEIFDTVEEAVRATP